MSDQKLTWNKKGVERMEYFVAERIAYDLADEAGQVQEWIDDPDRLVEELRYVRDPSTEPDFLRMTPGEAGVVMASMMRKRLLELLIPDMHLWGYAQDAIDRAAKDEDYDREFKEPEEYEIP